MAGTDSRFNAAQFRSAIKFAMQMGFPNETEKQITWEWTTERTYLKNDSGGYPYEWDQSEVTSTTAITPMIVDCAVKFQPQGSTTRVGGTELGIFDTANMVVTMLDTDYDLLLAHGTTFPDKATVDNAIYIVQLIGPPFALFEVNVYEIYLQAIDES